MFNLAAQTHSHLSIDCIKVCPYQPDLFALAYYQTNPQSAGAIAVAHISEEAHLSAIKPLDCPPLLHIVWSRSLIDQRVFILAAASRRNEVLIYSYDSVGRELRLWKTLLVGEEVFCLYIDLVCFEDRYQMVVSSNQSTVTSLILDQQFNVLQKKVYCKHEYAVWTCRLDPKQRDTFVCGDEVNSIYMYSQGQLVAKNSTSHTAGLCDLTFHNEHTLYSGGFDGVVCSYDTRNIKQHIYRQHFEAGTIWRVIPNSKDEILLCNSSQKKFQIIDYTLGNQLWNSGVQHESLAYAADWVGNILLTASFYDKKLNLWHRTK